MRRWSTVLRRISADIAVPQHTVDRHRPLSVAVARSTWGRTVLAILLIVAGVVLVRPTLFRVFGPVATATGVFLAETLPLDMSMCDRDWKRSDPPDIRPIAVIREEAGIEPTVVDPRPFAPCPPGPCRRVNIDPCDTVIFVRVADDGYVAYELRGGP